MNIATNINPLLFRPVVISLRSEPPPSQSRLLSQLREAGVEVRFLNCDSKFQFWKAIRKLRELIQQLDASILQSFLFHANVIAGLALRRFPEIDFFTGIRVADPSWSRHKLEKWATKNAQKIICVSQSVKEFAQTKMGLPSEKLIAIPNGIPFDQSKAQPNLTKNQEQSDLPKQSPQIVFVGRLEEQKGLVPFFKHLVANQNQLPDFVLAIVGEGSERQELEIISQQIPGRIRFEGWSDNPQQLIANSKLLILPSLWEGMPNVLMEAMSLSKPVVAFGVDGVKEICGDPTQAIEPGNYSLFLERVTQLLSDQQLAKNKGLENLQRIQSHFTLEKMIANYEAVYLGDPSPPD